MCFVDDIINLYTSPTFNDKKASIYADKIKPKLTLLEKFLNKKDTFLNYMTLADFLTYQTL